LKTLKVEEALDDPDWVMAMQEELNNLTRNEVWELVERPKQNVMGTKWVFRNKQDEHDVVTRNKARLVAHGFIQIEGLDFDETYAPVARLESIHILLAYFSDSPIPPPIDITKILSSLPGQQPAAWRCLCLPQPTSHGDHREGQSLHLGFIVPIWMSIVVVVVVVYSGGRQCQQCRHGLISLVFPFFYQLMVHSSRQ